MYLTRSTFVTKTRNVYGHQRERAAIGGAICKKDNAFEIKTDKSLGLCTLPGSAHKEDLDFRYKSVGITDHILANDVLYDLSLEMFKATVLQMVKSMMTMAILQRQQEKRRQRKETTTRQTQRIIDRQQQE